VKKSDHGFALRCKKHGKRAYIMPAEGGRYKLSGQDASVVGIDGDGKVVEES
jgi:hypothetical protein